MVIRLPLGGGLNLTSDRLRSVCLNSDCRKGRSREILLLHFLSFSLGLVERALLLGLFELSSCVNFLVFLHLGLHYLLVIALLRQIGSLHGASAALLVVFSLAEGVLSLRGQ